MDEFGIIPRSAWRARFEAGFGPRPARGLLAYVHHSVTIAPDLVADEDDYAAIRTLEEIGEERFGKGISYQHAITPAGLIFEGCGIDRVGAAIANYNTLSWNIVLVGNYSTKTPPRPMLEALSWLLHHGHAREWIRTPKLTGGHRDAPGAATACPGAKAYALIDDINAGKYAPTNDAPASPVADVDEDQEDEYDMDRIDLRNANKERVRGRHMGELQGLLLAKGYGPTGLVSASTGRPDSIGGPATRAALGSLQAKTGSGTGGKPDYVCGPKSWAALLK